MQLFFEFIINFISMGKPDKKDKKWLPILIIVVLLLIGFTMFYDRVN